MSNIVNAMISKIQNAVVFIVYTRCTAVARIFLLGVGGGGGGGRKEQ